MNITTGHCLCASVAFAYEGEPDWTLNCHCESCRRATSAAAGALSEPERVKPVRSGPRDRPR